MTTAIQKTIAALKKEIAAQPDSAARRALVVELNRVTRVSVKATLASARATIAHLIAA